MSSRVQGSGEKTADASNTLAFSYASLPTVGNYVFVLLSRSCDSGADSSVLDNQSGNSWARAVQSPTNGTNNRAEIWYAKVVGSTGTFTVTVTTTGSAGNSFMTGSFEEWTGIAATSPLDQTNSAANASATSFPSGNITTTQASETLFAVFNSGSLSAVSITAPGGAWTNRWIENGGFHEVGAADDQVVSSTGTYSATYTLSLTNGGATCIASFKNTVVATSNRAGPFLIG